MKNIYTKLCLSAIGCLMMASCDFLDVVPQGTATVDDIYRTQSHVGNKDPLKPLVE